MVADKLERQQLRGSGFGILSIFLQFIMIEPMMVVGDSFTNSLWLDLRIMVVR